MALEYAQENIWYDKWRYDEAECQYYEKQFGGSSGLTTLASQIAKAREEIQSTLSSSQRSAMTIGGTLSDHLTQVLEESKQMSKVVGQMKDTIAALCKRIEVLEKKSDGVRTSASNSTPAPPPSEPKKAIEDDDDDVDLFGSDDEEEDEAASKVREQRLKEYAAKKAKKPGPIAKSSVLLDCKPWDDETNMQEMENLVRKIEMDGLTWGAAKLVPLAFGIKKLSILCTVEDEKVSIDDLSERITEHENYVQSVDIAAFNKI